MSTTPQDVFVDSVEIVNSILEKLTDKERDIITKRFGLGNSGIQTLAEIGQSYGVTRERIRQVQCYVVKKMQKSAKDTELSRMFDWFRSVLKDNGDIIAEAKVGKFLIEKFPDDFGFLPELKLACVLDETIIHEHNKVDFEPHFRFVSVSFELIEKICESAISHLRNANEVMDLDMITAQIIEEFASKSISVKKKLILSAMSIHRNISMNEKGVSLTAWRHVNPKTLFDKIIFVLGEVNDPMHFMDLAQKIKDANFDDKNTSVQAVHNELINNPAFVLIGRGIYALKAWGYKEGTVSEVIESVLEKKGPMRLEDLMTEVLQRRKVKPITIQINLNTKKNKFRKNQYGLYELAGN